MAPALRALSVLCLLASQTCALNLPAAATAVGTSPRALPRLVRPNARAPPPSAMCDTSSEKAAEREETLEYFKTLGGFSFGSLGLFVALTAGAGMEDVQAGNLVLVALCVYGVYLLFFDGGVTQKALENQAIRQLAEEEGEIMEEAPRANVGIYTAQAATADPAATVNTLASDGFVRVDQVISPATASALLAFVNAELERKQQALAAADLTAEGSFGDVLMRENRYDLLLDMDPPVRAALEEALSPLRAVLGGSVGEDAELFELAALVSDPRAPRQPVHPDTPFKAGDGAAIVTTFVALQDVDVSMGPTGFIPQTHTSEAHARFNTKDDGGRERVALLRERPNHVGILSIGGANLIDSRLFHCGGANNSGRRRVLFYFSFRRRGKVTPSGSLLYKLRRAGYALDNTDQWLVGASATQGQSAAVVT